MNIGPNTVFLFFSDNNKFRIIILSERYLICTTKRDNIPFISNDVYRQSNQLRRPIIATYNNDHREMRIEFVNCIPRKSRWEL